jgi:acyl transferase domain-containing protein
MDEHAMFAEYEDSIDIAVVGMAGRFPKSADVAEYWRNLCDGRCTVTFFAEEDLLARGVPPEQVHDPSHVPAGNPLENSEMFDAPFFGYSPREAELMDPQHRVLLECAWSAVESAGYDPSRCDSPVGVYAGAGGNTYLMFNLAGHQELIDTVGGSQVMIGNSPDFLATRVSYRLGLTGPSVTVQSACSTSLVAVVLASQGLLSFQCDMALAGGVAIDVLNADGYTYSEDGIYSPDGYCRSFDADAKGTVSGNGVGMVVLKRLHDALVDGDHIHAVLKGMAINNDGARRVGFTAPSVESQAAVVATALANADVPADTIGYVEAHGTATTLGDPIEFTALDAAFRAETDRVGFCALGSVKTNIGHLDAAAGIAGLIKTVLAVEHGVLPPTLHFRAPNPRIDLAKSAFFVNTRLASWPLTDGPRRAGVSSFGLGGTNAHVVLEQTPPRPPSAHTDAEQLIVLSARTADALDAASNRLAEHLRVHPGAALADVAYTLQVGRKEFDHRRAFVAATVAEAVDVLDTRDDGRLLTADHAEDRGRPVAFLFTGFGERHAESAGQLYDEEPVFRAAVDECAGLLADHLGRDLREVLFTEPSGNTRPTDAGDEFRRMLVAPEQGAHLLDRPEFGYPALFTIEYALVALWKSWGVTPEVMVGHSLGEYVAACVAGVFSLADALRLMVERGRLVGACDPGAMIAVPLAESDVDRYMVDGVALAAVNAPDTCVLSGTVGGIDRATELLRADGVVCRKLNTPWAFHSPMMDAVVAPYTGVVRRVRLSAPKTRFVSNITGTWITDEQATDPDYWASHVRRPVRFADGLAALWRVEDIVMIEIGPGRALCTAALRHPAGRGVADRVVVPSLPDAYGGDTPRAVLLNAVARLWLGGGTLRFAALHQAGTRRRVPLPTYPFERGRYWLDRVRGPRPVPAAATRAPMSQWFYETSWQRLGAVAPEPAAEPGSARWLVFADRAGVGTALAARLAERGATVVTVVAGETLQRSDRTSFVIDPQCEAHYTELMTVLRADGLVPDRLVHCWSVDPMPHSAVDRVLDRGFMSLVYWARASESELMAAKGRWDLITAGACSVLGTEPVCPVKATVRGVAVVAPQEYPGLRCTQTDVDLAAGPDMIADRLLAELARPADGTVTALRGEHRWGRTFVPAPPRQDGGATVRAGGVYLITGGLGRIGRTLACSLAEAAPAVRLVLVGRNGLPPRARWSDPDQPPHVRAAVDTIRALEAMGARVLVAAADVADATALGVVIDQVVTEFGAINGVIHAAGATGPAAHQVLAEVTDTDAATHFDAKVRGVYALEQVLAGQPLDFAVLCSSVAALLGGLGFAAYAAANAFLDEYAGRPPTGGMAWTAIDWDAWRFPDDTVAAPGIGTAVRQVALDPGEGREVFERVLAAAPRTQVIVSTTDLDHRARQWTDPVGDTVAPVHRHARPTLRNPYVAPAGQLENAIAEIWQALLGVEDVGVHDNFFELGGSSLLGLQVVHKLRTDLRLVVPLTVVYEGPTIRTLAELIGDPR